MHSGKQSHQVVPFPNRVLIIDDEISNIQVLHQILGDDYEILVATNGARALELVAEQSPDLILLDIMMPDMDGYEVCRRIKADQATAEIPLIFITVISEAADEAKGLSLGAVDYLTKPLEPMVVQARVSTHLQLAYQRRQLEQTNQQLRAAMALQEDIERMMRHDLRTPLNAICGFPPLITAEGGLNSKQQFYLENVVEAGELMLRQIEQSMQLIQMERGVFQFQPTAVDLVTIIRRIFLHMEEQARLHGVRMEARFSGRQLQPNDCFEVSGESVGCYSLLANLIKNAVEAECGQPVGLVRVDLDVVGEHRVVQIHNSSPVPAELHDHFFEKYSTYGKHSGAGMGTYAAKLMAETYGAEVSMHSGVEEGTNVSIAFRVPVN